MNTTRSPIYSALLAALLLGGAMTAGAAENAGGQPSSTPTHTVPAKPAPSNLTIKEKSGPQAQPVGIEDEKKIKPSGVVRMCAPGYVWVPNHPGHGERPNPSGGGHCERKQDPKD